LAFIVNGLETTLNTSQKGCTYREVLEGFCYIKVLRVFWTAPDCPGNIGVRGIKEAGKHFICIRQRGIIYIVVVHLRDL
jgi:hypothetical protein